MAGVPILALTLASAQARIDLPETLYTVVGHEYSVHFENVCSAAVPIGYYDIHVTSQFGYQYDDRWTYVPLVGEIGTHTDAVTIAIKYQDLVVAAKTFHLVVKPVKSVSTVARKLLILGDSITDPGSAPDANAGKWIPELVNMFNSNCTSPVISGGADNCTVTTVGSLSTIAKDFAGTDRTVRHEARSGWGTYDFLINAGSPFRFSGVFDASQYFAAQSITMASNDWVIFHLGVNDIFYATSDAAAATRISEALANYDTMIASFKAYQAGLRFAVCLPTPPTSSQDAAGSIYKCATGYTRANQKRRIGMLHRAMLGHFSGREAEKIWLVATHANLDTVHDFPVLYRYLTTRNSEQVDRPSNLVHPLSAGQYKIADMVHAALRGQE